MAYSFISRSGGHDGHTVEDVQEVFARQHELAQLTVLAVAVGGHDVHGHEFSRVPPHLDVLRMRREFQPPRRDLAIGAPLHELGQAYSLVAARIFRFCHVTRSRHRPWSQRVNYAVRDILLCAELALKLRLAAELVTTYILAGPIAIGTVLMLAGVFVQFEHVPHGCDYSLG
jgi:hypothetical protein